MTYPIFDDISGAMIILSGFIVHLSVLLLHSKGNILQVGKLLLVLEQDILSVKHTQAAVSSPSVRYGVA